ncbi:hypothetical protein ES705_13260 [subsurface metagenome]
MANRVKLSIQDIGPLEKAIEKYADMGSGLVWYRGVVWDHRMARIALDCLKATKEEKIKRRKANEAKK